MREVGSRDRFFDTTRGRIVLLLMDGPRAVGDLADTLDLTDNAVRSHLVALERDGVIRRSGERRSGGRPAFLYRVTPAADELMPKAYDRALRLLLDTLADRMTDRELDELLLEAGGRSVEGLPSDTPVRERLERAVEAIRELGGLGEAEREDGRLRLRTRSCPLSAVVRAHPAACRFVQGALEVILDAPVTTRCEAQGRPTCTFEAELPEAVEA